MVNTFCTSVFAVYGGGHSEVWVFQYPGVRPRQKKVTVASSRR